MTAFGSAVPRRDGAVVVAVLLGAAGAALAAHASADGATLLPDVSAITADLGLTSSSTATGPAPTGTASTGTASTGARAESSATPHTTARTASAVSAVAAAASSAAVTPVASVSPSSVADTVPELTKATTLGRHAATIESAIDRFEGNIGTTRYEDLCERAVENAFGTQGHFASAIDDWHASDQHTDWRHAPRGALVFYDTSADGHVALSLGDGRVVSSSAHHQVGIVPIDYFQKPLGWAPSPY